jgi:ParB-like chromosome segregation protein Spo0J
MADGAVEIPLIEVEVADVVEVHPVAALFPMLAADELQALADDIFVRGLLHPIVLDADGRILDGRNRYAACNLTGVDPSFVTYDGPDPDGYALAVNVARRNLSKGQIAIVAARARRLTGQTQQQAAAGYSISKPSVTHADVVLDHAPDLADQVLDGALSLNDAYAEARKRKLALDDAETRMAELRSDAPDLADLVTDGKLTVGEAFTTHRKRVQDHLDRRRDATNLLNRAVDLIAPVDIDDLDQFVTDWTDYINASQIQLGRLDQAAAILAKVRESLT